MDNTWGLAFKAIMEGSRLCENCANCTAYSDDKEHFYCKLDGQQVLDFQHCENWKSRKKKK